MNFKLKLTSRHLLIILIVVLLGCSIFTCKLVEGLSGMSGSDDGTTGGKKKDTPVDSSTLQPLPYDPLGTSRPMPSPKGGMPPSPLGFTPSAVSGLMSGANNADADADAGSDPAVPFEKGSTAAQADVSSALPKGIPFSQIPAGDEDLYIRKSEVVPPVCPVCPAVAEIPREKPCPPCPACERCPEPAFECKKVPNYSRRAGNGSGGVDSFMPRPVLTDFSSFGM